MCMDRKRMKVWSVALLVALVAALLAGCGGKGEEIDPKQLADDILEQVDFAGGNLTPIAENAVANWYFLDDSVTSYAIYIDGTGATAQEIAVLKGKDTAAMDEILDQRLENLSFNFESYVPAEMTKIKNPIRVNKGNVVVMVLSDDPDAASKVEQLLK